MLKAEIKYDVNYVVDEIDDRIYGSFVEHMGRVVYSGIYEPTNSNSDDEGLRVDVMNAVKNMGVTSVRYPGGNFVSCYNWKDGVGPKKERPRKIELAWKSIETNEFGTNEFVNWCKKVEVSPIFTVNLGTKGIENAVEFLEYCNFPEGTQYSEMRRAHGVEKPYGIKTWCLGNEMDGEWQVGHKTAEEYGRLAAETGKAMKTLDNEIELIACGSSLAEMSTCPEWDMTVLDYVYGIADYIALHQYYGGQEKGTLEFLAQSEDFDMHIQTIKAAILLTKRKKRSEQSMKISVDEWGVWARPSESVNQELEGKAWQIAPAISEQIYTVEDALLFASMLMTMLKNVDVVKIACQSLLTNISACIMTEQDGGIWFQTIYYPFQCMAKYGKGTVLKGVAKGPEYVISTGKKIFYIDHVVVHNKEKREIIAYFVNRHEKQEIEVALEIQGIECTKVIEVWSLHHENVKATNAVNHDEVRLRNNEEYRLEKNVCKLCVPKLSFTMVRIKVK